MKELIQIDPTSGIQSALWRPSLRALPETLRLVPVTGSDAIKWTSLTLQHLTQGPSLDLSKGVQLGMDFIKSELLLPPHQELPVQALITCFSSATVNCRAKKLSGILHLIHRYPASRTVHKGLRFVTASLWASYAALGVEGADSKLQGVRIIGQAKIVWSALGWKVD